MLGEPKCPLGYPWGQLQDELEPEEYQDLLVWMHGQTGAICEGQTWNPRTKDYEPDACALVPHGMVVYKSDVKRFLANLPVID